MRLGITPVINRVSGIEDPVSQPKALHYGLELLDGISVIEFEDPVAVFGRVVGVVWIVIVRCPCRDLDVDKVDGANSYVVSNLYGYDGGYGSLND